jgi:hypothetical protein
VLPIEKRTRGIIWNYFLRIRDDHSNAVVTAILLAARSGFSESDVAKVLMAQDLAKSVSSSPKVRRHAKDSVPPFSERREALHGTGARTMTMMESSSLTLLFERGACFMGDLWLR